MGKEGRMEEEGGRGEAAGGGRTFRSMPSCGSFSQEVPGLRRGRHPPEILPAEKYLKMIFILAKVQAHPGCALPVSVYAAGRARGAERTKTEVRLPNVFRKSGIRQRRISCRPP